LKIKLKSKSGQPRTSPNELLEMNITYLKKFELSDKLFEQHSESLEFVFLVTGALNSNDKIDKLNLIQEAVRVLKNGGVLFIQGLPRDLPELGVLLEGKLNFKYWFAVVIMSSFQETTSSGQTTKAREMLSAFQQINASNSRYEEQRVLVNFVDGGGWLARKRDLERLVDQCHYFINLQNLDMLESIILKHIPSTYRI
jgi:SAM-dependent methyltransferase